MGILGDFEIGWTPEQAMLHTLTADERAHYLDPDPAQPRIEWRAPSMKAFLLQRWWLPLSGCLLIVLVFALASNGALLPAGLLLLVLAALVVHIEIQLWLRTFTRYIITPQRIIEMSGIFSKRQKSIEWDNITDLSTDISYIGGILGFGDIDVATANEASSFGPLLDVPEPREFQSLILAAKKPTAPPAQDSDAETFMASLEHLLADGGIVVEPRMIPDPGDPTGFVSVSGWRIRKANPDPPTW